MELRAIGAIPEASLAALRPVVSGHAILEAVVRWGLAADPPADVEDVVRQDEYTHDVILPVPEVFSPGEPIFLVYATT